MKQKVNYWTEIALTAKKQLQSQKIFDAKKHHFRHPKLSEITFETKEVESQLELSREERRKDFLLKRKERKGKLENIPYSQFHNNLVNNLYGKRVDIIKKNALIAAHEETIRNLIIKKEVKRSLDAFKHDNNKPNLLVIRKHPVYDKSRSWDITPYMVIPSSQTLEELRRIGVELADKLTLSMKDFFNIEIWEKSQYMKHLSGERFCNCRYEIGKNKQLLAA